MTTAKALRRAYDAALEEQVHITLNEAAILTQLADRPPLTQVELARRVGLSRARVGAHVDTLEARDAVRREADPADRRVWRVSLTRTGRSLWKRSVEVDRAMRSLVHQGLTEDDLDVLDRVLQVLRANVASITDDTG